MCSSALPSSASGINCVLSDLTTTELKETDLVRSASNGDWDVFEMVTTSGCSSRNDGTGGDRYSNLEGMYIISTF